MTSLPRMIGIAAVAALFTATLFVHAGAGTASAVTPTTASLAIDADTSDTCATIQSTATISVGTATSVSICLIDASAAPVNGLISAVHLSVTYTAPLTASNVPSDLTTDLNSNPNWAGMFDQGGTWDCNSLDLPASAPSASPSPATITCDSVGRDVAVSGNVVLATLTFDAAASLGTSTLAFTATDLSTGVEGLGNPVCGTDITCDGASITVQAATDTPTATVTATNTAPVALKTHTPTRTPTAAPTSTPTPVTPTKTPAPSATTVATSPTADRAGAIIGPNTGGGPGDGSSRSTLLFGAAMLAVAGAFATAMGRKVRR
jgi:hypothetical protein